MSRSVNKIENVVAIGSVKLHLNGMTLNGDATFAFQIHIVEHLPFGNLYGSGALQKPVGKGRLAVINVGYDAEVAYFVLVHHRKSSKKFSVCVALVVYFLIYCILLQYVPY